MEVSEQKNESETPKTEERVTILTVDKRERKIISMLERQFASPSVFDNNNDAQNKPIITTMDQKQIEVGDYIISTKIGDKIIVHACIERKSLADLSASIKDGRLENIEKMTQLSEETNCRLYLLIEGPLNPDYRSEFAGIKYANILAKIDSISLRFNLHVIRTLNPQNTAKRIKFLTESYARYFCKYVQPNDANGDKNKYYGSINEPLGKSTFSPKQKEERALISMWTSIARISSDTALVISRHHTLQEFILGNLKEEEVSKIIKPITGRPLPKPAVKVLVTQPAWAFSNCKQAVKFLSNCPRLSQKSAGNMLFANRLVDIAKMDVKKLMEVKTAPDKTCTENQAKTLIKMLHLKLEPIPQENKKIENNMAKGYHLN